MIAREAARRVLGRDDVSVQRIAAGRSCEAFVIAVDGSDDFRWVVRVPLPGTDRSIRFHAEAAVGGLLAPQGHPVASWTVVDVDGTTCAVGNRLQGTPIAYGAAWSAGFTAQLGDLLADLHALTAEGSGPLVDLAGVLRGETDSAVDGVRRRWDRAACWPFDGSDLGTHAVAGLLPELLSRIERLGPDLLEAAEGRSGVVHSDLHREHLLVGPTGELTGVLDFGDAFVGSTAWDFGLLHWYYGPDVSASVALRHPDGDDVDRQGALLAVAVGIYKLAKSPGDGAVLARLGRVLKSTN